MSVHVVLLQPGEDVRHHAALRRAARVGVCVCLWNDVDDDEARALDRALRERGGALTVRAGDVGAVLDGLHAAHRVASLWSHDIDAARASAVGAWASAHGVPWKRLPPRPGGPDEGDFRVQVPAVLGASPADEVVRRRGTA